MMIKKKLKKPVVKKSARKSSSVKKIVKSRKVVKATKRKIEPLSIVKRVKNNPIITPDGNNPWESKATFNPAALYARGKVHLVYRAIGNNDVSVLGYASSGDAINVNERLNYPIFLGGYNTLVNGRALVLKALYSSGGGWNGGSEDPRITLVGDMVCMLYTAFDGWGSLRMALTRISLDDFLHHRFNWSQPIYISRPGEIHKNWVIFPEKINGKFALLHSISPEILIEYVDSLDELGRDKYVNSFYTRGSSKKVEDRWDSWVRGAGPPPIKTKYGWLLLYHAMSERDPNRYMLGAMILDINDPTKVLYRSSKPLLKPDEYYENEGFKSGVVYSCGAVVLEDKLYIYYGGADMVTAVAMVNLDELLGQIISNRQPVLKKT